MSNTDRETRVYNRWYSILVDLKTDKHSSLIVHYPAGNIDNRDIAEEVKNTVRKKWGGPLCIYTKHEHDEDNPGLFITTTCFDSY